MTTWKNAICEGGMRVNEVDQLFACMLLYFSECLQHACSMPAAYTEGRLQVPPVRS
jgi:hypothetical protein